MLEGARIAVVVLGGISFGVAVSVLRQMRSYLPRHELFVVRLMVATHLLVVTFIAGILAERAGEPMSWQTPAAGAIFAAKLVVLLAAREIVTARALVADPPQRRSSDPE